MTNFLSFAFVAILTGAWITHVAAAIADEAWGLLLAGAIFFPIGIFHGITLWVSAIT